MAHRRKRNAARAEEQRKKRLEESNSRSKKYAGYALIVALLVAIGVLVSTLPTAPMQCFSDSMPDKLVFDARLFIWTGEPTPGPGAQFIYINYNIGREGSCRWPITTGPESPTCASPDDWSAERCADWVTVHIASPVSHQYTLGEFFRIWQSSPGQNRTGQSSVCSYFGPDGICGTRGPTSVSYNYGPFVPADPNMAFHPHDRIDIKVLPE
jgi:hypothetical protein